jgi:hypothetical protein
MCHVDLMNACDASCVSGLKNVFQNDLTQAEKYYLNSIPSNKKISDKGSKAKIVKKLNY